MTISIKRSLLVFFTILLAACGGDPGGGGQTATFSLSVSPASADVFQGARKLVEVTLTRDEGFTDDVEVSLEAPPEGVQSNTLIFPDGLTTSLLEVSTTGEVGSVLELKVQGVSGTNKTTTALQLTVKAPAPSSQELIQQALDAGAIDYGTSLLYRAYALFSDPTLPEVFIGSGSEEEGNGLFLEVQEATPTLAAEIQTKLEPFVVRPSDPASIFNTAHTSRVIHLATQDGPLLCDNLPVLTWVSKESNVTPIRVWMRCGSNDNVHPPDAYIDKTLQTLEKAYGPMTQFMGEPILDGQM